MPRVNLPGVTIAIRRDLTCHRCGSPALLAVRLPANESQPGETTDAHAGAQLCRVCDGNQPAAQGLLAFLTFYDRITVEHAGEFHQLLGEWVAHLRSAPRSTVTPGDFDADLAAWMRGDFD